MKIIIIGMFLLSYQFIAGQDLSYNTLSSSSIPESVTNVMYKCEGEIINTSDSSIYVTYTRLIRDIPAVYWLSSMCTKVKCYYVTQDLISEEILPNSSHFIDLNWMIADDESVSGVGYTEWEIKEDATGLIIDTARCEIVYESSITSNNEIEDNNIQVYPNPVSSFLTLKFEGSARLKIFSVSGVLVESTEINHNQVDVSHLLKGVYIGILENNNETKQFKFIKE